MDLSEDVADKSCQLNKLIQDMAVFKSNLQTQFLPTQIASRLLRNGPHQDLLQVASSGAAAEDMDAMSTEPLTHSEAEHCASITAAQSQLKDNEKAVDMIRQIIQYQNILIDAGLIKPAAMKTTMEGLAKAEATLAETTKRVRPLPDTTAMTTKDMNMDLNLTTEIPIVNDAQRCQQLLQAEKEAAHQKT
ncbi:hypothetical protein CDAR_23741 [Caerostris darwini]|uniref:Uncharacterized protein n=1 Tax=Caerostris darwini TaxID=1538125 RepID=A0AAV4U1I9_9ARAC|nr:hypothetical protein CDAR_23741 [Caerostris darwini]